MVYCDIYITDVTLLQWSHVRNTMTDHLKFFSISSSSLIIAYLVD